MDLGNKKGRLFCLPLNFICFLIDLKIIISDIKPVVINSLAFLILLSFKNNNPIKRMNKVILNGIIEVLIIFFNIKAKSINILVN